MESTYTYITSRLDPERLSPQNETEEENDDEMEREAGRKEGKVK
jgi:hypothetical protein